MDQIIEVLNKDKDALKILSRINELARRHKASKNDYELARHLAVLAAICQNEEAVRTIGRQVYLDLKKIKKEGRRRMKQKIEEKLRRAIEMQPTMSQDNIILLIANKKKEYVRLQIIHEFYHVDDPEEKIIRTWKGMGLKEGPQAQCHRRLHPDYIKNSIDDIYDEIIKID